MTPTDFVFTLFADVPPPPIVGSTEGTVIAAVLVGGALALAGFRFYKSKKK